MSVFSPDCLPSSHSFSGHDWQMNPDTPHRCRFIQQVGTVEPQDQRKELFGDAADAKPAKALTETAQASQRELKQE